MRDTANENHEQVLKQAVKTIQTSDCVPNGILTVYVQ